MGQRRVVRKVEIVFIREIGMVKRSSKFLLMALFMNMAVLRLEAADTIAGAFASEGTGARPIGMGGAFSAIADDANATYINPAGMAFFKEKEHFASFTHSNLFSLNILSRYFVSYAHADEGVLWVLRV